MEVETIKVVKRELEVVKRTVEKHLLDASLVVHELGVRLKALKDVGLYPEVIREDLVPLVERLERIIGVKYREGDLIHALERLRELEARLEAISREKKKRA